MEATSFLYALLFTAVIIYTVLLLHHNRRTPPLPPGPTGLPLVGSLPFLDPSLHSYFAVLSKKYGPIFSLRLGSKLAVVISSSSLARTILKEQDNIFANHDVPAAGLAATYGGKDIAWTPHGPTWRMLRRACVHEDMFLGGTDTTSATVEWAMAEILSKPEILQKLHEELDKVVGKDNLVEESHLPQLHFLSLVIKETLQLHPALPLLIPDSPSSPCIIDGYVIPESSRVFVNVWAIQRDPSLWKDPMEFRPERYLQENRNRDFTGKDFDYFPFGSCRRICAGIAMADRMVGYLLATMLHSFDWKLPEGKKVDLAEKFGIVMKKAEPLVAIPGSDPQGSLASSFFRHELLGARESEQTGQVRW